MRWFTRLRAAIAPGILLGLSACVDTQPIPVAPAGQSASLAAAQPSQAGPTAQQEAAPTAVPETVQPSQLGATAYLYAVRNRVKSRLQYPESLRRDHLTGTAEFDVTVLRNGQIVAIQLRRSSGNTAIDEVAEQAIRGSSPLPPMPSDLPGDSVILHAKMKVDPDHPDSKDKGARP